MKVAVSVATRHCACLTSNYKYQNSPPHPFDLLPSCFFSPVSSSNLHTATLSPLLYPLIWHNLLLLTRHILFLSFQSHPHSSFSLLICATQLHYLPVPLQSTMFLWPYRERVLTWTVNVDLCPRSFATPGLWHKNKLSSNSKFLHGTCTPSLPRMRDICVHEMGASRRKAVLITNIQSIVVTPD